MQSLGKRDYWIGGLLLAVIFVAFFHHDIWGVGWDSLNYLFGNARDFYDNCKAIRGDSIDMLGTPYPPSIYIIFAIWLYPAKLLGLVTSAIYFPAYLTYWLKVLTGIFYVLMTLVFYRVTTIYSSDAIWRRNATWLWALSPLAIFSEFIFSQYDVFYVLPSLAGFAFFIRRKIFIASLLFGLAITFKYFPAFSFIPLLLFFEKNPVKIAIALAIFVIPSALLTIPYHNSPAYLEGVVHHAAINQVYAAFVDVDGQKIQYLFASFAVLCGLCYMADMPAQGMEKKAAYIYLTSSILPFLFIIWHPQWLLGITPALALTTAIDRRARKFLLLDLVGMASFVAYISLFYTKNVDADMLQSRMLHIPFENSHPMAESFNLFGVHSANVFLSLFWAYLLLQIILKFKAAMDARDTTLGAVGANDLRVLYYIGIALFVAPCLLAVYKDYENPYRIVIQETAETANSELLAGHTFSQSFIARSEHLEKISLLLGTYQRTNHCQVTFRIVDKSGTPIATQNIDAATIGDGTWVDFAPQTPPLRVGEKYNLVLESPNAGPGSAITWWLSKHDQYYPDGNAAIDAKPLTQDFTFKLFFVR